jgi:hypothetical protein
MIELENRLYWADELLTLAAKELATRASDGRMHFRFEDGSVDSIDSETWRSQLARQAAWCAMKSLLDEKQLTPRDPFGIASRHHPKLEKCIFDMADAERFIRECNIAVGATHTPEQNAEAGTGKHEKWKIANTWERQARDIGEAWMLAEEKRTSRRPGVEAIAKHVEGELSNLGITGKRRKFLDWETIKREALTGITVRKAKGRK